MPWWIIADTSDHKRGMIGPYESSAKAQSVKDGMDDGHAEMYQTESYNRQEAAREIRAKRVKENGIAEGFKNFRHKGVSKEID